MTEVIWPVKMKILYGLFRKSVPIPALGAEGLWEEGWDLGGSPK